MYRVFRITSDESETGYVYKLHEVITDHNGNVIDYWPCSAQPKGGNTAELERDLRAMASALNKPVLEWVNEIAEEVE